MEIRDRVVGIKGGCQGTIIWRGLSIVLWKSASYLSELFSLIGRSLISSFFVQLKRKNISLEFSYAEQLERKESTYGASFIYAFAPWKKVIL